MKKTVLIVAGLALAALALGLGQVPGKLTTEPDPSFAEDALSNHRHPDVDTDVFLYINHWRNSLPTEGHGGFIERDILTPGDPLRPPKKGAVLKYIKAYKRAALEPRCTTQSFKSDKEQVFLCVFSGAGARRGGGQVGRDRARHGRLPSGRTGLPILQSGRGGPGADHGRRGGPRRLRTRTTGCRSAITARRSPASACTGPTSAAASPGTRRPSSPIPWASPPSRSTSSTSPSPMSTARAARRSGASSKGTSLLLFGNRLLRQEPGEAFLVPPNKKVPHSSINPSDEPMLWLYMGNRHDQVQMTRAVARGEMP